MERILSIKFIGGQGFEVTTSQFIKSVYQPDLGCFHTFTVRSSADCFKINFIKKICQQSNGLDFDQDRQNIGPDLGASCLQRQNSPLASRLLNVDR